jgi:hypothetical protein
MDQELEKYHKQNGALDLVVSEMKLKVDGLQKELAQARQQLADARALVQRFHHDLAEVAHHIQVRGFLGFGLGHAFEYERLLEAWVGLTLECRA